MAVGDIKGARRRIKLKIRNHGPKPTSKETVAKAKKK